MLPGGRVVALSAEIAGEIPTCEMFFFQIRNWSRVLSLQPVRQERAPASFDFELIRCTFQCKASGQHRNTVKSVRQQGTGSERTSRGQVSAFADA